MKTEEIKQLFQEFESAAAEIEGVECWSARQMQTLLGYSKWENFEKVIQKAKEACKNAGETVSHHFPDVRKTIPMPKGAEKEIIDMALTRYACYLVAQNGDSRKPEIAFAQNYFAVQTRRAEIVEQRLLQYERVKAREKLSQTEKQLSGILFERGVDSQGFAIIRSKGDQALFRLSTPQLKKKMGVPESRPVADFRLGRCSIKKYAVAGVFLHRPHDLRLIFLIKNMQAFITEYPQFFTASIKGWYKLLQHDQYKDIIVNSLRFLAEDNRIKLYAFVIMPDHIHLIWQMRSLINPQDVQRDFLKYTAQRLKHDLNKNHPELLPDFETDANDRYYQFWKRRALSIELRTDKVYLQKLNYIHLNPVKAGICMLPEEYKYSSAMFYHTAIDNPSASSGRISLSSPGLNCSRWRV